MGNDTRIVLKKGSKLVLTLTNGGKEIYKIIDILNRGGSCIVYKGRLISESNVGHSAIIKEFYPKQLSGITRKGSELIVPDDDTMDFETLVIRFKETTNKFWEAYETDSRHIMPPPKMGDANKTIYSVSLPSKGIVLSDLARDWLHPNRIAEIMISLCNAIEKFHEKKCLYLDIKPQNIFLFEQEKGLSLGIGLFDFDTVLSMEDLKKGNYQYETSSKGWAPIEQVNWQDKRMGVSY